MIKPNLLAVEIKETLLDSGFVRIIENGLGKGQSLEMEQFQVQIKNFLLDEESKPTPTQLFYADDVQVSSKNFYHFLPDSTYTVHFGELGFSSKRGHLWGLQINVHPLNQPASENYVNAYIPEVHLEGINLYQFYQKQGLDIQRLSIHSPWVKGSTFPKAKKKSFTLNDLYPAIAGFTPSLNIQQIQLAKGDFFLNDYKNIKPDKFHLGKVHLDVNNFQVDSTSNTKNKQFLADGVKFRLTDYELNLPDSLHKVAFKELRINTATKAAYVDSLLYSPILPKYEHSKKVGLETDHITVFIDKGFLQDIDLRGLLTGQAFRANRLILRDMETTVFRNKSGGYERPENHFPPLPRQLLMKSSIPIDLDTLELKNANVMYEEHALLSDSMGYFNITNINVDVHNVTNDQQKIEDGTSMSIYANCKVMDEGRLLVFFDMPLNSPDGEYYMEGRMDSMRLDCMNTMLDPVASLRIKQGHVRKIKFKVHGNDQFATGIMRFIYKRLRISVLNKKHKDGGLGSLIANTFVVIRNNPRRLIIRKGRIFFRRDTTRSIFHYWANTMLSGVKHSIGIRGQVEKPDKEAKQKMLSQIVERFKLEGLAERKAEKERKKALRDQLKKQRKEAAKNDGTKSAAAEDDDSQHDKKKVYSTGSEPEPPTKDADAGN